LLQIAFLVNAFFLQRQVIGLGRSWVTNHPIQSKNASNEKNYSSRPLTRLFVRSEIRNRRLAPNISSFGFRISRFPPLSILYQATTRPVPAPSPTLPPSIGIIGGSGLYQIDGLTDISEVTVATPFGDPSDSIVSGRLAGRQVYFLPRHARGHRILPHEINHRANIYALRSLGVRWIICVTAVGSLQEQYAPRHIVLPSQFFDRTSRRSEHTFFGGGIVAHVAFAQPISAGLREILARTADSLGYTVHNGGTYVNMDGPAFSTRAESEAHRRMGFDVIGMTNVAEARLAREAEIALATMAMITDYDCWKVDDEPVTAKMVFDNLQTNAATARDILPRVIEQIPESPDWPEHSSLDNALVTAKGLWPPETAEKLRPIIGRFL
jgi:5'-methylthioadenosine phosphorylase